MRPDHHAAFAQALADRYRIERELGRGGMAVVYLAHDLRHDRPVALKVLHPDLAHALGPERFQREIHVAARLNHPHILTVLDSGESAGQLWFTMPFVEGESLRSRLARESQLPVDEAVRIAREAADALDYAHRHGIVHRDVKPDNILLADGHALVADFGIARALEGNGNERLTATGSSIGTAAYMSPEQAAGECEVDGRSDIFSLGIVLYEMLAGTTPFAAATPQATIARRFTEDAAPVRKLRTSVPEPIDLAIQRALSRTVADRFPSARAFAESLVPPPAAAAVGTPSPLASLLRRPVLVALAAGLLIGGGFLFAWARGSDGALPAADSRVGSMADGALRIAVLPFDNLGDSADAYFADGVTDAVRAKLAGISGFAVIARASSEEYRGATTPPAQIADELGVDYLLTGTVRWVKQADGTSRVQVRPELVEIGDGTARTRWGDPFNAPLTDVFEVQEQIAGRVSEALNVAIAATDRQQLAEQPTRDLFAYDLYLQASAIRGLDPVSRQRALRLYEQAVERDSMFALAWAGIGLARRSLNSSFTPFTPQELREPLDRVMALAPNSPSAYLLRFALSENREQEQAIAAEAVARFPNDPTSIRLLGNMEWRNNDLEKALTLYRRASLLDPRNARTVATIGSILNVMGRRVEAREAFQRALSLAPGDAVTTMSLMDNWLADGDLAGARRAMNATNPAAGRPWLLAFLATYGDHYWLLSPEQQDTVLGLGVGPFDGDTGSRAMVFAQILRARGDSTAARRWAATASPIFERIARANPSAEIHALTGFASAFLGRHAEARRWLDRALAEPAPSSIDHLYYLELAARARMLAGDQDGALAALAQWAELRGAEGTGRARVHPEFAPLHGDPRFERLIARQ